MFPFLTLFWSWDSCCWSMSKNDHFPIVSFVWWAFLFSLRFLLMHPAYNLVMWLTPLYSVQQWAQPWKRWCSLRRKVLSMLGRTRKYTPVQPGVKSVDLLYCSVILSLHTTTTTDNYWQLSCKFRGFTSGAWNGYFARCYIRCHHLVESLSGSLACMYTELGGLYT